MTKPGTIGLEKMVVVVADAAPVAVSEAPELSVGALVEMLVKNNAGVEIVERVVALKERMEDRHAAREFAQAMARFQQTCPPIRKDRTGKTVSEAKGIEFKYKYAALPTIAKTIAPHLAANGLSYSWDTKSAGGELTVTCTVRHRDGHSVTSSCTLPTETRAGMSAQQKVGSARTFGERLSLIQALGITTADPDLDGADPVDVAKITQQQADDLRALAEEVNVKVERVLRAAHVEKLEDILASGYVRLVKMLEAQRNAPPKEAK